MDMSRSMLPHLERLKSIATQLGISILNQYSYCFSQYDCYLIVIIVLAGTIRNLSSQSSFGFGTFVDKPTIPFSFGAKNR